MEIKNKIAVITGGASGMGAATAKHLAAQTARVVLLDFDYAKASKLAQEIGAVAVQCDVSDASSGEAALAEIKKYYEDIHILINCAGIAPATRAVGRDGPMPLADFRKVIEVNLIGTFNMTRLIAAHMMQQKPVNADGERGVIINTASVSAYEGQIGQAAYSASKGGVVSMTLPLAREFAKFGIRVMTIAPGIISTPMMATMSETVQQSLAASVPFPMRLGDPLEYAKLAQHIVENSYLNGSVIRLDAALRMKEK